MLNHLPAFKGLQRRFFLIIMFLQLRIATVLFDTAVRVTNSCTFYFCSIFLFMSVV